MITGQQARYAPPPLQHTGLHARTRRHHALCSDIHTLTGDAILQYRHAHVRFVGKLCPDHVGIGYITQGAPKGRLSVGKAVATHLSGFGKKVDIGYTTS